MKLSDRVDLTPDYQTGGWFVTFDSEVMRFTKLDDAVETVLELSLVIAIEDAAQAKEVEEAAVSLKDAIEAFRGMIMTWFQAQIPDPHAVSDMNNIN